MKYILLVILANYPPAYAGTYDNKESCFNARQAILQIYKSAPGVSMCIPAKKSAEGEDS